MAFLRNSGYRVQNAPASEEKAEGQRRGRQEAKDSLEAASDMTSAFAAPSARPQSFPDHSAGAMAQESTNRVATMTDWNVFVEESPKECWGVSKPKETVNSRDGKPVSVRRGDILLFVTFRPGKPGEISFTGGYPFAGGSTVEGQRRRQAL
jgi:hypothetical protein